MDMDTNVNQKVSCLVNYLYEATESDELSLRPGDVVKEVERLPGGWWRGELRGRRGMFPDNFVSVIEQANVRSSGVQGRCRAVYSYQPANSDELTLQVGDVLEVLGELEEGWWQGRREGKVGVFPSNFVVMLDPPTAPATVDPAPALPPKPTKELCRVLFPYSAVNDDELTLSEGDIVAIVSKDAPDRGWWRGELHGRVGLFPDNFVQILPPVTHELEEQKPERPPAKATAPLYPVINKYSEKTTSVKELTTAKISLHKENTISKESSTQSTVTHTNKSESEKITNSETVTDSTDGQVKKPPVPTKKSPTPSTVSGLFSGLKNKMLSSSSEKSIEKSSTLSTSGSNSSGEWDKLDGAVSSRAQPIVTAQTAPTAIQPGNTDTFDKIERNSILNDPRAQRVRAPRRRPPSQVFRDDEPPPNALSNGHETEISLPPKKPISEKLEEIKPKAPQKPDAPWMAELKLNQAKKTNLIDVVKSKTVTNEGGMNSKSSSGSTDRLLEIGSEEKWSTHSMEMSKSTSSISNRISVLESFEKTTKTRLSLDSKKDSVQTPTKEPEPIPPKPAATSPVVAGRTLTTMLDDIKKPPAPTPFASHRNTDSLDKMNNKHERITTKYMEFSTGGTTEKSVMEHTEKVTVNEKPVDKLNSVNERSLERRPHGRLSDKGDGSEALIAQLNNRIANLEKLLELQNAKFNVAIEELNTKLTLEKQKREALQTEVEKLAHCVTSV